MKFIKGLFTFIISFVLVVLIIVLTASYTVKDVVQHQLVGEVAKKFLLERMDDEVDIDTEIIEEMMDDEKTNGIIDSALIDFSSYIEGTTDGVSDETISLIIDFCVSHKSDLEEIAQKKYDISDIDSAKTRKKLKESLDDAMKTVDVNKNSPVFSVVTGYSKLTSDGFRKNILIIICSLVFLLGLINWSLYKWMKPVGSVLITSGIMVLLSYGLSSVLFSLVKDNVDIAISINVQTLLILGIIYFVSGIALLIIYSAINKVVNKKKKQKSMIEDDDEEEEEENTSNNNYNQVINETHQEKLQENNINENDKSDDQVVSESSNDTITESVDNNDEDNDIEVL